MAYPTTDLDIISSLDTDTDDFKLITFNNAFQNIQNYINGLKSGIDSNINNKVDKVTGKGLSTNDFVSASYYTKTEINTELAKKVDKVTNYGLSKNDFTDALLNKLNSIESNAQVNTVTGVKGDDESTYRTGQINITKANIGLGNVANSTYAGGTAVTLNGTSKAASTASFYAPTSAGTSGYVLKSNGSGSPSWSRKFIKTQLASTSNLYGESPTITVPNLTNYSFLCCIIHTAQPIVGDITNTFVIFIPQDAVIIDNQNTQSVWYLGGSYSWVRCGFIKKSNTSVRFFSIGMYSNLELYGIS